MDESFVWPGTCSGSGCVCMFRNCTNDTGEILMLKFFFVMSSNFEIRLTLILLMLSVLKVPEAKCMQLS